MRLAVAALLLGALVACGGQRDALADGTPVGGYHPERFADIPLPPGWALDPTAEQLAVETGAGLVRRYEVTLVPRKGVNLGTDFGQRNEAALRASGWEPTDSASGRLVLRKALAPQVTEVLTLTWTANRITYRLRPAP